MSSEKKQRLTSSYTISNDLQQTLAEDFENSSRPDALSKRAQQRLLRSGENDYDRKKYFFFEQASRERDFKYGDLSGHGAVGDSLKSNKIDKGIKTVDSKANGEQVTQNDGDRTPPRITSGDRTPPRVSSGDKTPPRKMRKKSARKSLWDVKPEDLELSQPISATREVDETLQDYSDDTKLKQEILQKVPVIDGIPLSDKVLNELLPPGFKTVPVPSNYELRSLDMPDLSTLSYGDGNVNDGYTIPEESHMALERRSSVNPDLIHDVPGLHPLMYFKESDVAVFGKLIETRTIPDSELSSDELKERQCMKLILSIKNSEPNVRKISLRQLMVKTRTFGPKVIFDIVLPLLMSKSLEEEERHLLVKIIGRVMFALDIMVRPYTRKILIVIMPLLIDENQYAREEARAIVSNLAKAVGLAYMISTLRVDIDHPDDYVRNLVSVTFAVVASSLGLQIVLPFLKAICNSKKSWLARHTGVRIIRQIPALMGPRILPHLDGLVNCLLTNVEDQYLTVRTTAASAIASLARASKPYGFESFEPVIEPLLTALKRHRGRSLAAFLEALGSLIPLMDEEYGNYYARQVLRVVSRQLSSPEIQMKYAILRIIEICCSTDSLSKELFTDEDFLDDFFSNFWTRRSALEKKTSNMCISACYSLSLKVGAVAVVDRILITLKDGSDTFREMALNTISMIIRKQGSFELTDRTVSRLLDGTVYCIQHQGLETDGKVVTDGFGYITESLGIRMKPHNMSVISALLYRLKNKEGSVREQAADMIEKSIPVLALCSEEDLLIRLGTILYESLGEVYPFVLGSILGALRAVIKNVKSLDVLSPPISQILATLTPILRNKHLKVQRNVIDLIADIAERAKDYINHREWMRISFELLEMLKAPVKKVRMSANKAFGLIAQAIGPSDVLVTLLNNLRVQERQLRVCTAVAIGIVAKVCLPYTVLPALMNEYRYPDKNVQNGILKSLAFMFEYIGDEGADYIYATTPLLVEALTGRGLIHRQTAASVVKHMALGSMGLGYEDAFINFLNLLWPNIFETSPHVIARVVDAIESIRYALGVGILMNYVMPGLFHPARKVRASYWRVYNRMYISSAHAMVPYYPRFERVGAEVKAEVPKVDEHPEDLGISELDIWI